MIIKVTDINRPELQIYSKLSEPQLYHYFEPERGIFIAESPMVISRALDAGYEPLSFLVEEKQLHKDAESLIAGFSDEIPVYVGEQKLLEGITGYKLTRGVLCAMRRKETPAVEEICSSSSRIAILENITNPTNVGAIFRSAAALGMDAVLLSPECCDPLYRRAVRVSVGTVFQIPWAYISPWPGSVENLKAQGFHVFAMALKDDSVKLDEAAGAGYDKIAVVLGNEAEGISDETIEKCDAAVIIPMHHGADSLNVSTAAAVAFWELRDRRQKSTPR